MSASFAFLALGASRRSRHFVASSDIVEDASDMDGGTDAPASFTWSVVSASGWQETEHNVWTISTGTPSPLTLQLQQAVPGEVYHLNFAVSALTTGHASFVVGTDEDPDLLRYNVPGWRAFIAPADVVTLTIMPLGGFDGTIHVIDIAHQTQPVGETLIAPKVALYSEWSDALEVRWSPDNVWSSQAPPATHTGILHDGDDDDAGLFARRDVENQPLTALSIKDARVLAKQVGIEAHNIGTLSGDGIWIEGFEHQRGWPLTEAQFFEGLSFGRARGEKNAPEDFSPYGPVRLASVRIDLDLPPSLGDFTKLNSDAAGFESLGGPVFAADYEALNVGDACMDIKVDAMIANATFGDRLNGGGAGSRTLALHGFDGDQALRGAADVTLHNTEFFTDLSLEKTNAILVKKEATLVLTNVYIGNEKVEDLEVWRDVGVRSDGKPWSDMLERVSVAPTYTPPPREIAASQTHIRIEYRQAGTSTWHSAPTDRLGPPAPIGACYRRLDGLLGGNYEVRVGRYHGADVAWSEIQTITLGRDQVTLGAERLSNTTFTSTSAWQSAGDAILIDTAHNCARVTSDGARTHLDQAIGPLGTDTAQVSFEVGEISAGRMWVSLRKDQEERITTRITTTGSFSFLMPAPAKGNLLRIVFSQDFEGVLHGPVSVREVISGGERHFPR
ncbi:MAG: hypothetical protein AAFW47_06410 [Pseudomonadota bacterium]